MRELRIDFENEGGLVRRLAMPLLAASLVLGGLAASTYHDAGLQLEYWNDEVARLQRNDAPTGSVPVSPRVAGQDAEAELNRAREIVGQLALPWDQLFLAVEAATPPNVALLGVEPNAQKRSVRLTGEGKDIHAVLAYVQQLEAQPLLRDVYLVDHGTPDADPERPARFVIEAMWGKKS